MTMTEKNLPRRRFLAGSAAVAAGVAVAGNATANAQLSSSRGLSSARLPQAKPAEYSAFMHGVASGDPMPNAVIIWTRVTVEEKALPGSGIGAPAAVKWEVASDKEFKSVVRSGEFTATAASDHTVKVDVSGLNPATTYYYRFSWNGKKSPTGTTHTAPETTARLNEYKLALASCANWECGYFGSYRGMARAAQQGKIDIVVFLGDYIYEYPTGEYAGKSGVSRPHVPTHEIVTLKDYRERYGRYRTDRNLQAAHALVPWVVVWDDHESANDSWREGAENHTPEKEGPWSNRVSAAQQAYYEWLPVRITPTSKEGHLYRSYQFGDLIKLTMMDLRTYRDEPQSALSRENGVAGRTMLGSEQFNWVKHEVETANTAWNVLGNSVMISPMEIGHLPATTQDNRLANQVLYDFTDSTGIVPEQPNVRATGIVANSDQWDGYRAERAKLLDVLSGTKAHTLVLTGDIHSEWAHSVQHKGQEIGCEMVCSSISAPNVDEIVTTYTKTYTPEDNRITHLVEGVMYSSNPWVNHVDFDSHGFGIANVSRDRVKMDFYRVSDVEDPGATAELKVSRTWVAGQGFQKDKEVNATRGSQKNS